MIEFILKMLITIGLMGGAGILIIVLLSIIDWLLCWLSNSIEHRRLREEMNRRIRELKKEQMIELLTKRGRR
jgi:hypothetical protein